MPTKFVNILQTSKLRIRGQYLDSVSYVLLHFLTLRLYDNLAPGRQPTVATTLREISGTYCLTWVSLAIVSRRPRIIRSIDPTVANFQVNDPDLCKIRGDENHNLPFSLLLNFLCYTIESVG